MSFKLAGGKIFALSHTFLCVRVKCQEGKIDLKKALKQKFIKIQIKKITCGLEAI
jgi:hypothetical protein